MADKLDSHTIAKIVCLTDKITRARTAREKAEEELGKALMYADCVKSTASETRVANAMANMDKAREEEAKAEAQAKALSLSIQHKL
jgi:hypothetical protein